MPDDDPIEYNVLDDLLSGLQPAWKKWKEFGSHYDVHVEPPEQGSTEWKTKQFNCLKEVLGHLKDKDDQISTTRISKALESEDVGMSDLAKEWLQEKGG